MKNLFLFIVLINIFNNIALSQNTGYCGRYTYQAPPGGNPDSAYYDRFGNVYYSDQQQQYSNMDMVDIGYFTLCYVDVPANYRPHLEAIFLEATNLVHRRTNYFDCGEPVPQEQIMIRIDMSATGNTLAAGSGYTNYNIRDNCTQTAINQVYTRINGGQAWSERLGIDFDAYLMINPLSDPPTREWRFGAAPFNPNPNVFPYDFRSVILHEILHMYGFETLIEVLNNGFPDENAISFYDKYLGIASPFDPNQPMQSSSPLFESNCMRNCWHYNTILEKLDILLSQQCQSNRDIVIGNIAPVLGGNGPVDQALAHLNRTCHTNGNVPVNYLMFNSFEPREVRDITIQEKNILCLLGYELFENSQAFCESSCATVPYPDISAFSFEQVIDCCIKQYETCVNEPFFIPFDDITFPYDHLQCNDFAQEDVEVTDMFYIPPILSNNPFTIIRMNNGYEISSSASGEYFIQYTMTSCDCKQVNSYFTIYITPCKKCTIPPCENLACIADFEQYSDDDDRWFNFLLGGQWAYVNSNSNSPDLCELNGNTFMKFIGGSTNLEGIAIPLQAPILPNCDAIISLKAFTGPNPTSLDVYGSSEHPCLLLENRNNIGLVATNCGNGNTYDPIGITNFPINFTTNHAAPSCPPLVNFEQLNYTYTNLNTFPINFIILTPEMNGRWIYLDDIVITTTCLPDPEIVSTIDCRNGIFEVDFIANGSTYRWNFGDPTSGMDNESTKHPASHLFTGNGTFTVTVTVKDACGTEKITTTVVTIDCNTVPVCNCPTGYTVGMTQSSVTDIENTQIPVLSWGRDKPICINGRLNITATRGTQFFLNNTILMGPGAFINIEPNSLLWTANSDYQPCGDQMYKGIVVAGGYIAAYNNKIYDAHHGIEFTEGSSVIAVDNNLFDRNYIGIEINGLVLGNTKITNNDFFASGTYLADYYMQPIKKGVNNKTWAGINVNLSNWTVNDNNVFDGIGSGVIALNSTLKMENNFARDLIFTFQFNSGSALIATSCPSIIAKNNEIENCYNGMQIQTSNALVQENIFNECIGGLFAQAMNNRDFRIINNKFNFINYGIEVRSDNLHILNISENDFTALTDLGAVAIYVQGASGANNGSANIFDNNDIFDIPQGCRGIWISQYERMNIYRNEITYRQGTWPTTQGILLWRSNFAYLFENIINGILQPGSLNSAGIGVLFSPFSTYCCNEVPGNTYGMSFTGDNEQSHLRHNIYSGNSIGLLCDIDTWIGEQNLGYSNIWSGQSTLAEAKHGGLAGDIAKSRFFVTPPPSEFFPDPLQGINWFFDVPGNNNTCFLDVSCGIPPERDDDEDKFFRYYNDGPVVVNFTDEFTSNPASIWGIFGEGQSWNAKIQLIEKIDVFPELLGQSNLVDAFYSDNNNGLVRDFLEIRKAIQQSSKINSQTQSQLDDMLTDLDEKLIDIDSIDLLLAASNADTSLLITQRNILLNAVNSLSGEYFYLTDIIESSRVNFLNQLLDQISGLNTTNQKHSEEKVVSFHLGQYLILGSSYLSTSVLSELFDIADQCIHQNSYAISIARNLYNRVISFNFDDQELCNPPAPIVSGSNKIGGHLTGFNVFPNPADQELWIESKDLKNGIKMVAIYDLYGKLVIKKEVEFVQMNIKLLINNYISGLYFIEVEFADNSKKLKKFSIK